MKKKTKYKKKTNWNNKRKCIKQDVKKKNKM